MTKIVSCEKTWTVLVLVCISDPRAERCPVAFSSLYPSLSGVSAPFSSSFPAGGTEKSGLHVILGACAARVLQALIPINCREQEVRFILHDRVMFWGFNKLPLSLCWVDFPRPGKTKMFALFPSPFSNDSGKLIFLVICESFDPEIHFSEVVRCFIPVLWVLVPLSPFSFSSDD